MQQQKTVKSILWYGECSCLQHCRHLYSWRRITQTIGIPSRIPKISQWNKCSTYLKNCVWKIRWDLWSEDNQLGKLFMEVFVFDLWWTSHQSSAHKSLRFLKILYCVWVKYTRTLAQTQRGSKVHRKTETWTELMVIQVNSSGIFSQDSPHCSSATKFKLRLGGTPENFTGRIIFMSMFNDISGERQRERMRIKCSTRFSMCKKIRSRWSFLGPGSEKKWYSISEDSSQGEWDKMAEKMMITLAESGHPVFRATSPLSRGQLKSKGGGKLSIHCCADLETITTVFRTITSVNQLSLHGTVAEMCEKYESCHAGRPVVGEQSSSSFVPNVVNTNVPLHNDDPTHKELLLQRGGERIEKLSQQDKLSKFCTRTVFMTKDTEEFSQFTDAVACREYTLPRDEDTSEPNCWIRGNTKFGPVLEVTTCCLQGKYGVEIRIMYVNKDNSHSWVRISHGLNKSVTDLNNKEQETSEMQFEEYALRLNASDFASRTKGKAKPQKRDFASSSTRSIPIGERTWTDVEPGKQSLSNYPVSKKLIHLLRPTSRQRWSDWILEDKKNLQKHFLYCHHWSDEVDEQHGRRRRTKENISVLFWLFRNNSIPPSSSRSFTGQCHYSGRFLQVLLSRRMCNQVTFHHQFRIDTRKTKIEQQTYSIILSACGSYGQRTQGSWYDRLEWTASCTIHAESMEETSKTRCIGSTSTLLWRKDWSSIKHDRTLSFFTKHSQLIVSRKLFGWKLEKSKTRRYMRHLGLLQRFPWSMTGWKIWVQKLLDNQKEKLRDKQKVPNQANQIQTQIR